jgi:hypothetical protein
VSRLLAHEHHPEFNLVQVVRLAERLSAYFAATVRDTADLWQRSVASFGPADALGRALRRTRLGLDLVPSTLLPALAMTARKDGGDVLPIAITENMRAALGAYTLCMRQEQRARRCLRLLGKPEVAVLLAWELANAGCEGWPPCERSHWLSPPWLVESNRFSRPGQYSS